MKFTPPYVKLLSATPDAIKLMTMAYRIMHHEVPNSLKEFDLSENECSRFVLETIGNTPHQTAFEMVHFVFLIKNVSRAFQQQLTRHRLASYIIQSLRVWDVGNFASESRYSFPANLDDAKKEEFHASMLDAQAAYRRCRKTNWSVEQARAVLPLAIHSPIIMGITFRSLYNMIKQRLTRDTQSEFRGVAWMLKEEVGKEYHVLGEILHETNRT